jgi:hypothetical protein
LDANNEDESEKHDPLKKSLEKDFQDAVEKDADLA